MHCCKKLKNLNIFISLMINLVGLQEVRDKQLYFCMWGDNGWVAWNKGQTHFYMWGDYSWIRGKQLYFCMCGDYGWVAWSKRQTIIFLYVEGLWLGCME